MMAVPVYRHKLQPPNVWLGGFDELSTESELADAFEKEGLSPVYVRINRDNRQGRARLDCEIHVRLAVSHPGIYVRGSRLSVDRWYAWGISKDDEDPVTLVPRSLAPARPGAIHRVHKTGTCQATMSDDTSTLASLGAASTMITTSPPGRSFSLQEAAFHRMGSHAGNDEGSEDRAKLAAVMAVKAGYPYKVFAICREAKVESTTGIMTPRCDDAKYDLKLEHWKFQLNKWLEKEVPCLASVLNMTLVPATPERVLRPLFELLQGTATEGRDFTSGGATSSRGSASMRLARQLQQR